VCRRFGFSDLHRLAKIIKTHLEDIDARRSMVVLPLYAIGASMPTVATIEKAADDA